MMRKFKEVAVGGTFDQLHRGHKMLLLKAFEVGQRVQIGLTSDDFVSKMDKPHLTASYKERLKELRTFLRSLGLLEKAKIIPINDPYGTAASQKSLDALIVSDETQKTALGINKKRIASNFPPLRIVTINMVPSQNCDPISTTRIREGKIDREGRLIRQPDRL
jgi:pantetheine-phosphate adenylyltransferase